MSRTKIKKYTQNFSGVFDIYDRGLIEYKNKTGCGFKSLHPVLRCFDYLVVITTFVGMKLAPELKGRVGSVSVAEYLNFGRSEDSPARKSR